MRRKGPHIEFECYDAVVLGKTNYYINLPPHQRQHTLTRSHSSVIIKFHQCCIHLSSFIVGPSLEKRTRLFLALLAAFGGRPGDVFHSGTLLHLLLLVYLRV